MKSCPSSDEVNSRCWTWAVSPFLAALTEYPAGKLSSVISKGIAVFLFRWGTRGENFCTVVSFFYLDPVSGNNFPLPVPSPPYQIGSGGRKKCNVCLTVCSLHPE